jgi:hypothetical protein
MALQGDYIIIKMIFDFKNNKFHFFCQIFSSFRIRTENKSFSKNEMLGESKVPRFLWNVVNLFLSNVSVSSDTAKNSFGIYFNCFRLEKLSQGLNKYFVRQQKQLSLSSKCQIQSACFSYS